MTESWQIKGELVLNCCCSVFCPCVISLGKHPPTEGYCHGWAVIGIKEGNIGRTDLSGINVCLMLDIPGKMANGNWTAALYVDEAASAEAVEGLARIFSGKIGGTTSVLGLLVSTFLGVKQVPIKFERKGKTRLLSIPRILDGVIDPVPGKDPGGDLVITNSEYWMGPDVTVGQAQRSKYRDFGRVWDLSGKSSELVDINWKGP